MAKTCKAPEEIPGIPEDIKNTLGDPVDVLAENRIFDHYCRSVGVNEFTSIFPKRAHDGTQVFRDVTGLNTQLFIAFLKLNNPGINEQSLAKLSRLPGGGIKIPDWMTHRPVASEFEFYEVKPNSASSIPKGKAKILSLIAFCGLNNLPYKPGTTYSPDESETLFFENKGFIQTEVSLHWFKKEAGLIVYEVCIENKLRQPEDIKVKNAADAAAVLLLMLILAGLRAAPALE